MHLLLVYTWPSSARQHTYDRRKFWLLHTCLEPPHDTGQLLLLLLTDEMSEGTGQGCCKLTVSYSHAVTNLQHARRMLLRPALHYIWFALSTVALPEMSWLGCAAPGSSMRL